MPYHTLPLSRLCKVIIYHQLKKLSSYIIESTTFSKQDMNCGAAAASFGILQLQIESVGMYTVLNLLLRVYGCRWASNSKCGYLGFDHVTVSVSEGSLLSLTT